MDKLKERRHKIKKITAKIIKLTGELTPSETAGIFEGLNFFNHNVAMKAAEDER